MKVVNRQIKGDVGSGYYYFGDYGEIPVGISYTEFQDVSQIVEDKKHYHKESSEYYIVFKGELQLEISDKTYTVDENQMIMVEPGEIHYVKAVTKTPLSTITFATVKKEGDKVNV